MVPIHLTGSCQLNFGPECWCVSDDQDVKEDLHHDGQGISCRHGSSRAVMRPFLTQLVATVWLALLCSTTSAFRVSSPSRLVPRDVAVVSVTSSPFFRDRLEPLRLSPDEFSPEDLTSGVVELKDNNEDDAIPKPTAAAAAVDPPFLSQRTELDPDALKLDLGDAKQTRVIVYIVLSLLPVLFLIPFMLGSRDLLPLVDGDLSPVRL